MNESSPATLNKTTFFSNKTRKRWTDPNFWRKICPGLSIEVPVAPNSNLANKYIPNAEESERRRRCLIEDGFVLVDDPLNETLIKKVREGVEALQGANEAKFPASFLLLFDETWELGRASKEILKLSSHASNDFNFDILAWYIESGGFSPHRDRQPEDAPASFHPDQQAKFITHWIALSDATPENSCLYVIPKKYDPGYTEGDTEVEEPLRRALSTKESFQHIRALPRDSGYSLLFTHRIIHWGSARVSNTKMPPRIALSFVCSDDSYEKPYIDRKYFESDKSPPFHIRLLLVCAQLLIYYQRFDLRKETIKACYEYCKEYEAELEETYRHKVFLEFVNAMKEVKCDNGTGNREVKASGGGGDDDEDEEEKVLEEMLNAEDGGYGEFEDDYDNARETSDDDHENADDRSLDDGPEFDDDAEAEFLFGKSTTKRAMNGDMKNSKKSKKA
jgi:hypothetical protein